MDSGVPQAVHLLRGPDSGLRYHRDLGRDPGDQLKRHFQGGGEGLEVPVVDPDERGLRRQSTLELLPVMDLHQGRQAQVTGVLLKSAELLVIEDPGDEEGPIRPCRPGLEELHRMEDELLPEDGDRDGLPHGLKVGERPPEVLSVREDANGCGSGSGVHPCHLDRIQVGSDESRPRGTALHFRHYPHLPSSSKGPEKVPGRWGIQNPLPQLPLFVKERLDLPSLRLHDAIQDATSHTGALRFGQPSGILYSVLVRVSSEGEETMPLTKRQKEILDFIHGFIEEQGYAPSFEEIARAFGYSSLATVHEHLSNLERKGYIRKAYNESRSIEMVPEEDSVPAVELPLLGAVAAGLPIEAIQGQESLSVPMDMVRPGRDNFVLRVEGDSMIDEQIRDGDYIVVTAQPTASDGEVVVALVGGESATVKKLFREPGNRIRLQPANPSMEPIVLDAGEVAVQGVVVGLIRRF